MADTHETIADIIAEKRRRADEIERDCAEKMKRGEMVSDCYARELVADIRREADRLEAAWKRECAKTEADALEVGWIVEAAHKRELSKNASKNGADFGQLGDAAKLREALEKVIEIANEEWDAFRETSAMWEIWEICKAALAAPARNCDVYTSDKLKVKFNSELASELPIANEHEKNLVTITAMGVIDTLLAPATENEGGAK